MRSPEKYFIMQEVGSQNVKDVKLAHKNVSGLVLRERWNRLNPKPGQFNPSFLEAQLARCQRMKKQVILSIYTGSNAPTWIAGPKFGPKGLLAPYPFRPEVCDAYRKLMDHLGTQYKREPSIVGVEIGGPTCPDMSIEMHYNYNPQGLAGYTEEGMRVAWKHCAESVGSAFPDCAVISDGGPAPGGARKSVVTLDLWEYCFARFGERFIASHCALKANTTPTALHHAIVHDWSKRGRPVGFEMACGKLDGNGRPIARFGGSWAKAKALAEKSSARFLKFYQWDVDVLPDWS